MKLYAPSRISRRLGENLFFKAERDASPKSAYLRRPSPPGMHTRSRRRRSTSEFAAELIEKQKLRHRYGLSDTALKGYARQASRAVGKTKTQALAEILERRLDNVVYRLGLAPSRRIARQLVSHGHIQLNERRVRTASHRVRPGDRISVREPSRSTALFEGLAIRLKKYQPPEWLAVMPEEFRGEVRRLPADEDNAVTQNLSKVIEYYSR